MTNKQQLLETAIQLLDGKDFTQEEIDSIILKLQSATKKQIQQFIVGDDVDGWDQLGVKSDSTKDESTKDDSTEDELKDVFENSEDGKEYLLMRKLTGTIHDLSDLDEFEQKRFLADYYQWIESGKPKPKMPQQKIEQVSIPQSFYRLLHNGKDMMYFMDNKGKFTGYEQVPVFAKQTNPQTGESFDSNIPKGHEDRYTTPFNSTTARKKIAEAQKLNPPNVIVRCYLKTGGSIHPVKPEDYTISSIEELHKKSTTPGYLA